MGKSGKNKSRAAPAASSSASAAPPPAPPVSWMDSLSAEDQKIAKANGCTSHADLEEKKQKMEAARKKAMQNQQKDLWKAEQNRQWEKDQQKQVRKEGKESEKQDKELQKTLAKAKLQGIVEAVWDEDGQTWWAQVDEKDWRKVKDQYYCMLCDKNLNGWTLAPHLDSQAHVKKVAWAFPGAAAAPICPPCAPPKAPSSAPPVATGGYSSTYLNMKVESWMEACGDGVYKCLPCGKHITEDHLTTQDHINRVNRWKEAADLQEKGYPAPREPHLAWVPWDEKDPSSRELKCLLCNKFSWAEDTNHSGCPDDTNPMGSKDHLKNLRNWDRNKDRVREERLKWHPEDNAPTRSVAKSKAGSAASATTPKAKAAPTGATSTPAPWAKAAPATSAPAPWAKAAPAAVEEEEDDWLTAGPKKKNSAPALPEGWEPAVDEASGSTYYYHAESGAVQWEPPTPNDASQSTSTNANLPPGWHAAKSEGETYYYNDDGDTSWTKPPWPQ